MARVWTFALTGLPPSPNRYLGKHWAVRKKLQAPMIEELTYRVRLAVMGTGNLPLDKASLHITLVKKRLHLTDPDNVVASTKALIDTLVREGLLLDDKPGVLGVPTVEQVRGKDDCTILQVTEVYS